jgi:hypothetical protein
VIVRQNQTSRERKILSVKKIKWVCYKKIEENKEEKKKEEAAVVKGMVKKTITAKWLTTRVSMQA